MKQKRALYLRILSIMIALLIAVLDICLLFKRKAEYSQAENRALQAFPSLSVSAIASGKAGRQFDDYISDQFPFRTAFVKLNSLMERAMGSRESNGVIYAEDGYLIRRFESPDEADYVATLSAIKDFTERYPEINHSMLLVPSAVTVYADKLPYGAVGSEENDYIGRMLKDVKDAGVDTVDVSGELSSVKGQMYYRTDHHWKSEAALIAYRSYASARGLGHAGDSYVRNVVTDSFSGTLTALSGFRTSDADTLAVYLPEEETDYTVTYADEGRRAATVFDLGALERRNKYEVFFGGNHARIDIETDNGVDRTLLLFKDSYANCFIQFLIPDYSRIIVIDPRYFTGSVDDLIEGFAVTDVLYLYNAATLSEDRALRDDLSRRKAS